MRELAIKEFDRLIRINHVIDDTTETLNKVYDNGMEIGRLRKLYGDGYSEYMKIMDIEKVFTAYAKELNSKRISNTRKIKYNGPEITSNRILVCDFGVQDTLNIMKQKDSDYMYFERDRYDKKAFEKQLLNESDEYKQFTIDEYHTREVLILMTKLYQLGFQDAYESTTAIPSEVKRMFEYMIEIVNFENSIITDVKFMDFNGSKVQIKGISDAKDLDFKRRMIAFAQDENPDWQDYEKYFPILNELRKLPAKNRDKKFKSV